MCPICFDGRIVFTVLHPCPECGGYVGKPDESGAEEIAE